jgi:hypothetical protein
MVVEGVGKAQCVPEIFRCSPDEGSGDASVRKKANKKYVGEF